MIISTPLPSGFVVRDIPPGSKLVIYDPDPAYKAVCVAVPDGGDVRVWGLMTAPGFRFRLHEWLAETVKQFPHAERLLFERLQADGSFKPFERGLR